MAARRLWRMGWDGIEGLLLEERRLVLPWDPFPSVASLDSLPVLTAPGSSPSLVSCLWFSRHESVVLYFVRFVHTVLRPVPGAVRKDVL